VTSTSRLTHGFAGSPAAIHSFNRIRAEVDFALHQMCSGYLPSPCSTSRNAGICAPRPGEVRVRLSAAYRGRD